jgi:4-amino-4-deoxy-L-arabinose transferase-like glycosyltransferase
VNIVAAGPAILAGILIFLGPGLVFLALLRGERERVPLDERLYLAVGVSVAVSAWVALALAEAGRFSLVGGALVVALACVAALVLGRRRVAWPLAVPRSMAAAVALLGTALLLDAHPGEYLVGGRDPGTYVATMALIGRTGGISYVDPVVQSIPPEDMGLFFRHPGKDHPDFSWGRFMGFPLERPETAEVFPEFFHLFPAFGAYLFQAMGVRGALATPIVFGVLGSLGAFFAFRRLFGAPAAFLGALLLSLNVVQVWFARFPVSEPMSQFLILLGLVALGHWEDHDGAPLWGILAGAALGLSLLVRIDSILIVGPLVLYLLVRRAHGDLDLRSAAALLVPFTLLLAHAGIHASIWSRKYLISIATRRYWQHSPAVWILAAVAAAAAVWLAARTGPRILRALEGHGPLLRRAAVAAVTVLALYAYFVRPSLSAWAGGDGNPKGSALADPGILVPLGFSHLAAHDAQAFLRLGWFVSPVALALGVGGLVLVIREWRPRYLFPVLLALTFSGFYLYKIRVHADYFFALRRFVPVTLPFLFAFAALLVIRLASRGLAGRLVAAAIALFLGTDYLRATIPVVRHVDWKDSVRLVDDVARRFGPDDVVIFEQVQSVHLLAIPLWAVHGVNVLELARFNPDPDQLRHLIQSWRGVYKNVYFVVTYRTNLCGLFLQRVEEYPFATKEWERTYDRAPVKAEPRGLRFTISRVVPPEELQVPALPEVDIGGSDDFQVSGFFDKEGGGDQTYRWTGSCASVYLPGARPGATLAITASAGERPAEARPPVVTVSLSGADLGSFLAGPRSAAYSFRLPDPLPPGPPVLRLDVPAWRPVNFLRSSSDVRDLGVMVGRIQVEP